MTCWRGPACAASFLVSRRSTVVSLDVLSTSDTAVPAVVTTETFHVQSSFCLKFLHSTLTPPVPQVCCGTSTPFPASSSNPVPGSP